MLKFKLFANLDFWFLLAVLFLSAFRFVGLDHGNPYVSNIDEPALIRSSLGLRFNFWIDHFDWPHANFYINYFYYFLFIKIRGFLLLFDSIINFKEKLPLLFNDPFVFYFLSRLLNSVLSILTALPIYLFSKKAFDKNTAQLAVIIYLLIPFNLFLSKLALQESSLLFFIMFFVYFAYKASIGNKIIDYIWSGVFLGLATGVKYNAVLFSVLLPAFILIKEMEIDILIFRKYIKKVLVTAFLSAFVLFLSIISVVKYPDVFWSYEGGRGILWQLFNNLSPLSGFAYFTKLYENILDTFSDYGLVVSALFLVSVVLSVYNIVRKKIHPLQILLLCFYVVMFMYISRYGRSGSHYFVPLYGIYSVYIACTISALNFNFNKMYFSLTVLILGTFSLYKVIVPFISLSNFTEAAKFLDERNKIIRVYCRCSDSMKEFNSINNLNYKNFNSFDETSRVGDLVVSNSEWDSAEVKLIKEYNEVNSITDMVFIYQKVK